MNTPNERDDTTGQQEEPSARVSRRSVLKRGTGAMITAGVGAVIGRRTVLDAQETPESTPGPGGMDPVPEPPATPPPPRLSFFRPDQATLVEAIAARLIPGSPDDPGAREAGVVYYIDGVLSHGDGFTKPTYRQGPWAMTYEGENPPPEASQNGGVTGIWVHADQIDLYGFQSRLTPREIYENGLRALDRYATERFGGAFVSLSEEEQDQILAAMEDGEATGFDAPTGEQFFQTLYDHTIEGFFSDPVYGGNRDMVGWRLVGFPGAQRGYSPREMRTEGTTRQPISLADLSHFHPGRPEEHPVLPVRGSNVDDDE